MNSSENQQRAEAGPVERRVMAHDPAYVEMLERKAALFDAVEAACRDLPPDQGYVILSMEAGSAYVHWGLDFAENGIDGADKTLAEQIREATDKAIKADFEYKTREP